MPRALYLNQNNNWRKVTTPYVKDAGIWKPVINGYINQNGTWKIFYGPPGIQVFNIPGIYIFTVPFGINSITADIVGGGGSGGGGEYNSDDGFYRSGGGGGSGGYLSNTYTVTSQEVISITVGAGAPANPYLYSYYSGGGYHVLTQDGYDGDSSSISSASIGSIIATGGGHGISAKCTNSIRSGAGGTAGTPGGKDGTVSTGGDNGFGKGAGGDGGGSTSIGLAGGDGAVIISW